MEVEENRTGLSSTAFLNPNLGTNTFARMGASSGLSEEGAADIGRGRERERERKREREREKEREGEREVEKSDWPVSK